MGHFLRHIAVAVLLVAVLTVPGGCGRTPSNDNGDGQDVRQTQAPEENAPVVKGKVRLPGEQSSAGIMVFAGGTSLLRFTNPEGDFTFKDIEPGEYEFYAQKAGYNTESLGTVNVEETGTTTLPELVLSRSGEEEIAVGGIIGNVELEDTDDYSNVIIEIEEELIRTVTDETGVYFIPNLTPGVYRIVFKKSGYQTDQLTLTVETGPRPTNAPTIRLTPVERPPGKREIRGVVEMYDKDENRRIDFEKVVVALEGTSHVAVPDGAGKFRFTDLNPGTYVITAAAPGYENRKKIEVDLTSIPYTNVTVVMEEADDKEKETGGIQGTATLSDGSEDHSGITIGLMGTHHVGLTDAEGNYRLTDLPEGTYSLLAELGGYTPVRLEPVIVTADEITELPEIELELYVEPPEVLFTQPSDGEENISVKKEIPVYVWFSKKMQSGRLKQAVSVSPGVSYRMYAGKEHPQSDFDLLLIMLQGANVEEPASFETTYNIRIDSSATDFDGQQLLEPYVFSFTTGEAEIIETRPGYGAKRVFLGPARPVVITFNAQMDHETIDEDTISLEPETFSRLDIYSQDDPETGWTSTRVHAAWEYDTEYTLTVRRGVRTIDGSSVSNTPYRLKFTTTKLYEYQPEGLERQNE